MEAKRIGVLVGSLRRESYSRKVADCLERLAPDSLVLRRLMPGDLPLYNQDYDDDGTVPEAWKVFREQVGAMDGYLFVTPEYNRSMPPLLKNALDVASRPYGQNKWGKKPGAVISVSTGALGGFGANHHLRQTLTFLDVYAMQQPEAYLGNCAKAFDDAGHVAEGTEKFLRGVMEAYAAWVLRF